MYNRKNIIDMYNGISETKMDENNFAEILPKLYMIINKIKPDKVEIIELIDALYEIKKEGQLYKINPEIIDLIEKISKSNPIDKKNHMYFDILLKNVLLPYNKNICDNEYNLIMFLSEFEILLELINKYLNEKEIAILGEYNHELKQIAINYKDMQKIYNRYVKNDIILDQMISHFATMLYFNLDDFNYDYDILIEMLEKIINNYQSFIDYCCSLGIQKNFIRLDCDVEDIEIEYIVSYEMLKFFYKNKKEERIKRK